MCCAFSFAFSFGALPRPCAARVVINAADPILAFSKNSLRFSTDLEVRLVKGLSLELDGSISRVRDQLYLSAEGLTPAEILLQQQELATDYRYFLSAGFSYSFGSIFNNVVNPRFGSGSADLF